MPLVAPVTIASLSPTLDLKDVSRRFVQSHSVKFSGKLAIQAVPNFLHDNLAGRHAPLKLGEIDVEVSMVVAVDDEFVDFSVELGKVSDESGFGVRIAGDG